MKKTGTMKIVDAMSNWKWISNKELSKVAWWRFGGLLYMLRKKGFKFKKKPSKVWGKGYVEYWKLVYIPIFKITIWGSMKVTKKAEKFCLWRYILSKIK
jgi:hypothetical protein